MTARVLRWLREVMPQHPLLSELQLAAQVWNQAQLWIQAGHGPSGSQPAEVVLEGTNKGYEF